MPMAKVPLPYAHFSALRLRDFVHGSDAQLHQFDNWQYEGRVWTGESINDFPFTEFLCPVEQPDAVGAVCLHLEPLPADLSQSILARLSIPVRPGASRTDIESQFGAPDSVLRFVEDRETLVYRLGEPDAYEATFTVHAQNGLIHMTVIKADLLDR